MFIKITNPHTSISIILYGACNCLYSWKRPTQSYIRRGISVYFRWPYCHRYVFILPSLLMDGSSEIKISWKIRWNQRLDIKGFTHHHHCSISFLIHFVDDEKMSIKWITKCTPHWTMVNCEFWNRLQWTMSLLNTSHRVMLWSIACRQTFASHTYFQHLNIHHFLINEKK